MAGSNSIGLIIDGSNPLPISLGGTGNTSGTTTPSGSASGDLSGTYPNPTVSKINGVTLGLTTATSGNILIGSGTSWSSNSMGGDATINSTGVLSFSSVNSNVGTFGSTTQVGVFTVNAKGLITSAVNATISGVPPSGSAGGDLTGTYPNPTLSKISSVGINSLVAVNGSNSVIAASGTYGISISGNAATANTATTSTTSTTATNANNVATTSVTTNANYFPLFVSSSSNSNQADNLSTGLTFNPSTNIMTMSGINLSSLTSGSVLFSGGSGAISQNNANLFWDNTNDRLGIGTNSFDFSGVDLQITNNSSGGSALVIRNTLSGSTNQAALYICRGDKPNGNAIIRFFTGNPGGAGSDDWDIGTFNNTIGTNTSFLFTSGSTTWLSLTNTGVMNLSQLTASQSIVTDASKNLISLAYTSSNTASTIVSRDSSGNFSAGTITANLTGTASLATTAINAANANNVLTVLTTTNANYFPLFVSSSSNINQSPNLSTGITFNPSTNTLNTNIVQATGSLVVGGTTNSAPLTVIGTGGTTGSTSLLADFTSTASPTIGNIYQIQINKSGTDALLIGINKNTITGGVAASSNFISTYLSSSQLSFGRGNGAGLPGTSDLIIDGSGNVIVSNLSTNGIVTSNGSSALSSINTASTYTPTIGDGTNNFTTTTASGVYYQIGPIIFLQGYIVWTSKGSASAGSSVQISVPSIVGSSTQRVSGSVGQSSGISFTGSDVQLHSDSGLGYVALQGASNVGVITSVTVSQCASSGNLQFFICFWNN